MNLMEDERVCSKYKQNKLEFASTFSFSFSSLLQPYYVIKVLSL